MTASEGLLHYILAAPRIDSATLHRYLQTLARFTLAATQILPSRRQCEDVELLSVVRRDSS